MSTVASVGGLGLGPLVAGLLAQYAPAPRVTPFVLEIVLLRPAAVAMAIVPNGNVTRNWRPRRPTLPASVRPVFRTTGAAIFLAFSVIGLFLALVPTYVTKLSGDNSLTLAGGAVALMLACSATAQIAGYGRPASSLQSNGLGLLAGGLVLLATAGAASSLALLLIATVVGGSGHGMTFLGGLSEINRSAPAERHAEVLSTFYVVIYLGVGVPVIAVGFLATVIGLLEAVQIFAAVIAALCLVNLIVFRNRRMRPGQHRPLDQELVREDG